jgi:hypothetical protein
MTSRNLKTCSWLLAFVLVAFVAVAGENPEAQAEQGATPEMSPEMQAMMDAWMKAGTPGEKHAELAAMAGTWKATVKSFMGPGEPMVSEATTTREMILGGRVLGERFEGDFMGQPFVGRGFFGYDNARQMYWSVWMDSMSTTMMTSWGTWDEEKQAIVMEGRMTDPMSGEPVTAKSIMRTPEPGKEVFEMWEPRGEGGEMVRTMEIVSVRQ